MALSDFLLSLAGKAEQLELRTTVQARVALETVLATQFGVEVVQAILSGGKTGLLTDTSNVAGHVLELLNKSESEIGSLIFKSLIEGPMGIDLTNAAPENQPGIETIKRVIGFGAELSLGTAAVSGALEPLLGSHGLKGLLEAVRGIPDEIGLNYFMGTVMANFFETATGGQLREAIAEKVRPTRLEWPQVARLLKAKQIDEATATDKLKKAGFRDEDIPILRKLDNQLLSVSDLQLLHDTGFWDDAVISEYLDRLGFDETDKTAAFHILAVRAGSEGATTLRTIARNAYLSEFLSEGQYRTILQDANTPTEAIDLLVESVKLERDAGRLHLSVAEIKDLWLNNHINSDEVRQRLGVLGASDETIADLITVWGDSKKTARSGIGTAKILGYLIGGVITKEQAYAHLIQNGMNQKDAQFLVDHPTTHAISASKPISPATIVAAFKDDVLGIDEARTLLQKSNVNPAQIDLLLANATAVVTKGKKPRKPTKTLSETNVIDALKLGLAAPTWAERELETLGWSADDAALITMTELVRLDPKNLDAYGWQQLT